MTILFKYLTIIVSTAVTGKFIYIQHVFYKYNRSMPEEIGRYYEAFPYATYDSFLLF